MKRIALLIAMALTAAVSVHAQIPDPGDPVCAHCNVDLKSQQAHKPGCPYYSAPSSEESSSSSSSSSSGSTHLRDYKPLPEVKSRLNISSGKYHCMYNAGDGDHMITCPACGNVAHERWCAFALTQKAAIEAKAKALAATTPEGRRKAIIDFHVCEDNLLNSFDWHLAEFNRKREEAERKAQSTQQDNATYTHTVAPGTYIAQHYDKELTFGGYFARAIGATMPNGEERWLLYTTDGKEVGQFSKVEFVEANGINQYILVRDDNGKWGIYSRGGTKMCEPKFESVKMLSTVVNEIGGKMVVFDVTMRNNSGVLQHGIYNPDIEDMNQGLNENNNPMTIPCVYDYVELIDRSCTYDGVLVKVRKNGLSGVIGTFNGKVKIPVAYSYINTYFTLKGGMYLLVGDGNRMGAYHVDEEVEEVVPVTDGYTLDKVKSLIAEKEKE
jgi:hypothetical protein